MNSRRSLNYPHVSPKKCVLRIARQPESRAGAQFSIALINCAGYTAWATVDRSRIAYPVGYLMPAGSRCDPRVSAKSSWH
jgi:hypothetical protein